MKVEKYSKIRLLKPEYRNNINKLIEDISDLPILDGFEADEYSDFSDPWVADGPEIITFDWYLDNDFGVELAIWFKDRKPGNDNYCIAIDLDSLVPDRESVFGDKYEEVVNKIIDFCCEPDTVELNYYKPGFVIK